ncbi:hypothetical protein [Mycobacteroides salmoniphilum]|nr:hypothetical protein [Mycobacteroides salmoniphilum]
MPQAWIDAFRPACRARGMRFVNHEGFVVDDVYITAIRPWVFHPDKDTERLQLKWEITIKPLAADEILWAAFLPDVKMGPQMQINRRVNGAFQVQPLRLERTGKEVAATEPNWGPVLDEFDRIRAEFIAAHPAPAEYILAVQGSPERIADSRQHTRMITALMAAGRNADAARMADEAIASGESGGMSSTVDVLKYLAAYAKGPESYSEFRASLLPTHDYRMLCESERGVAYDLSRAHHAGMMDHHLRSMNGSDPWAVILSVRPPQGTPQDPSTLRYIQAAGTAQAMMIELCQSGGTEIGAVSVRSIVGHPHNGPAARDFEIVMPRALETIARHEVFTAEEAVGLFERFYRTDTIGDGYVLRAVEGYTADGGHVYPSDRD